MPSRFGISGLRSIFDDRREGRKESEAKPMLDPDGSSCSSEDSEGELSVLIENIVIPKLLAHAGNPTQRISEDGLVGSSIQPSLQDTISEEDVDKFVELTTQTDASELVDFATNCLDQGNSVEMLYVNLLAPAARKLGEMWDNDTDDFIDVTMGLWRIQEVLRELSMRAPPSYRPDQGQRSGLFSSMPGEQHSLGTLMIAECFQRSGWDADVLIEPAVSELTAKASSGYYDLIALTLTNDCSKRKLTGLVHSLRSISNNPAVSIIIGGRFVIANPQIVEECGADGTASDAAGAITLADQMVPARSITPRELG